MHTTPPHVLVGVIVGQPDTVVTTAASFAQRFGADLVCASVNGGRYSVREEPDGTVISLSFDPDLVDSQREVIHPALHAQLETLLNDTGVPWSVRALAGGPADELAKLADRIDACMIVIGTREAGIRGAMHEFLSGSVAAQLAHRQHRPIVVVPLNPVPFGNKLPWEQHE